MATEDHEKGDAKTGLAGESSSQSKTARLVVQKDVEEAHILEERVVAPKPSPLPVSSQPAPGNPAPVVPQSMESIANNLAGLLDKIKLPSRKIDAPEPTRKYDTSLSTDSKDQATKTAALEKASATARAITESLPTKSENITDDVRALHTLKDDLQHVVRDQKISLVRAVALEEEKRHHSTEIDAQLETHARTQKGARYGLFVAAILFILGTLAIGAVLYVMAERTQKSATSITARVLFAEDKVQLPVDALAPADFRREIGNARLSGSLTLGAILEIIPVRNAETPGQVRPLTFSEFITAIGARPPAELMRAVSNDYFLGLHTVDENAPVLVIQVTSYELAFAAMLEWEKNMNADLSPIFTAVPSQVVGPDGLLTTRKFSDTVMRNYDARALTDDANQIQLYYSFPTRNVLIIAESPYSFSEILSRLRADRKL